MNEGLKGLRSQAKAHSATGGFTEATKTYS